MKTFDQFLQEAGVNPMVTTNLGSPTGAKPMAANTPGNVQISAQNIQLTIAELHKIDQLSRKIARSLQIIPATDRSTYELRQPFNELANTFAGLHTFLKRILTTKPTV